MNDRKRLLKKALGILIHLSELSGRTKFQHKNDHDLNSVDYYLLKREELKKLIINYKINKKNILGHSDIAPDRKTDPGEKFPWKTLSKLKLAYWHSLEEKKIRKLRLIKLNKKEEKNFFESIKKIGYSRIKNSNISHKKILIKSFQRRFRQSLINGIVDQECLIISKNLLKS